MKAFIAWSLIVGGLLVLTLGVRCAPVWMLAVNCGLILMVCRKHQ